MSDVQHLNPEVPLDGRNYTGHDASKICEALDCGPPSQAYLAKIKAPLLMLCGEGDHFFPKIESELWHQKLKDAGVGSSPSLRPRFGACLNPAYRCKVAHHTSSTYVSTDATPK